MRKINTILLLSGGDSSRFWPLKEKNLTTFLGKTLIEHQINELIPLTNNLIIVTNEREKEEMDKIAGGIKTESIKIEVIIQKNIEEGQAGAVLSAKGKVEGEVLILNGNDLFDFSVLQDIFKLGSEDKKDFVFLARKVNEYFPGGYLELDGEKIINIVEKPDPDKVPSNIVKLVVDYFSDFGLLVKALEHTSTKDDDWYEKGLGYIISKSKSVSFIPYEGVWYTIKYPWHILDMNSYFLSKIKSSNISKNVQIAKTAVIEGPVHIEDNVKIGDFAKIVGPCFIGEGTIIGDFSLVRSSNIGKHSLIGGYSEVTRSYLGEGVMLHRNYVGDSILADNVLMGAGAVTANFRFDEKTVNSIVKEKKIDTGRQKMGAIIGARSKIGVHCTIIPGVKIGSGSFISPHTLVNEDVEDNIFLYKGIKKENRHSQ